MAEIGIVPGQDFDHGKLPVLGHRLDPKLALLELVHTMKTKKAVDGWLYWTSDAGRYGTDYEQRAMVTMIGPRDELRGGRGVRVLGKPLDGARRYLLRFGKGETPPARATWSVSMYDPQGYYVPNAIGRYNVAPWMPLTSNDDGSLDIYIQAASPGEKKEANWLPAPASGPFSLTVRIYWPADAVLDGTYTLPPVTRLEDH